MKRLITICAVVGMFLVANSAANATLTTFWMDSADLDDMTIVWMDSPGATLTSVTSTTAPAGRIAFKYEGDTGAAGVGKIQIGYRWAPQGATGANSYNGNPFPDLSDYDEFKISFHNQGTEDVEVNIWLNTGYTDPGWEQQGYYSQNNWSTVEPCTWIDLVLDFHAAEMWWDQWPSGPWGQYIASGEVPYRNHVTGIGIALVTPGNSSAFSVDVDTVPEPATIALLGLGSLILVRRRPGA